MTSLSEKGTSRKPEDRHQRFGWGRQMWRSFEVTLTALKDFNSVE